MNHKVVKKLLIPVSDIFLLCIHLALLFKDNIITTIYTLIKMIECTIILKAFRQQPFSQFYMLTIFSCYGSILVPYGNWNGQWFEHSVSQLQVCLPAEGAKNVSSWPWLSPLQGLGSLTMAFLDKFAYKYTFELLLLNVSF